MDTLPQTFQAQLNNTMMAYGTSIIDAIMADHPDLRHKAGEWKAKYTCKQQQLHVPSPPKRAKINVPKADKPGFRQCTASTKKGGPQCTRAAKGDGCLCGIHMRQAERKKGGLPRAPPVAAIPTPPVAAIPAPPVLTIKTPEPQRPSEFSDEEKEESWMGEVAKWKDRAGYTPSPVTIDEMMKGKTFEEYEWDSDMDEFAKELEAELMET